MKAGIRNILMLSSVLVAGVLFSWWSVVQADRDMRFNLLRQTRLVAQALSFEHVETLSGTEADLASPKYLRIKEQLATIRQTNPHFRFLYLLGRKANGVVFFFVDSEPAGSKDYSPPGQAYEEAPIDSRRVFTTRTETLEGPVSDRWGRWVSALIPIINPHTGAVVAVLGTDIDAHNWNWMLARAALPPALLTLALLTILLIGSALVAWRHSRSVSATPRWMQHLDSILAVVVGLVLTLFAGWMAHTGESINRVNAFNQLAASTTEQIAERMRNIHADLLESLALFYENDKDVTSEEFKRFTAYLTEDQAFSTWEWSPVVPTADKSRFEEAARAEGLTGFEIWQKDAQGTTRVPATARAIYHPIFRVAPLAGNERALGYDLGSEPLRRSAIEEATRTGLITATEPITLVQEAGNQKGILVFRPVFGGTDT
ncbi:MAG: CHASE domain-containing protein, partial [bacterium]